MTYNLVPREELLTPEYWGGIDINDASQFDVPTVPAAYTTRKEYKAAQTAIVACMADVASGQYTEVKTQANAEFNPSSDRLADGTVVVLDREHLMRWAHPSGDEEEPKRPNWPSTSPPIETPFAEYWHSNQGKGTPGEIYHFGDEQAVFAELDTHYGRFLEWGVLLSRGDGPRLLETWGFSVPKLREFGISVPSYGNEFFHRAEVLPLAIGQAAARPALELSTCIIYSIDRVKEIRVIYPANASPPKRQQTLAEQLSEGARRLADLGRAALPRPTPIPI